MKVLSSKIVYYLFYCVLPAVGYRANNNGALGNQGSNGYYWSSTQYNNTGANRWNFNSSNSNLNNNANKANGYSVRCVK